MNVVVCVSEGIHDKNGTFICEYDTTVGTDIFGNKMLAGCGKYLENLVKECLNVKARSIELNVNQRCSVAMISHTDQQEAIMAGRYGLRVALDKGITGKMITFVRCSDDPYVVACGLESVDDVCNKEKHVPLEWITKDGTDVSEAFITYVLPLIQGVPMIPMGEDGLPAFADRKKKK
jgi:6-phosphofructokinase 1